MDYLYTDQLDTRTIGNQHREFVDLAKRFASSHVPRIIQMLLFTRVVTPSSWAEDLTFGLDNPFASDLRLLAGGYLFKTHKV